MKINDSLLIFGASGNTGMMAVQLGKRMASRVIAVSTKKWIKEEYGADYLITDYNHIIDKVKEITNGKMANIVINSLCRDTWKESFSSIGINGRGIFPTMFIVKSYPTLVTPLSLIIIVAKRITWL